MNFNILFRKNIDFEEEFEICKSIFKDKVVEFRSVCENNSTIIGRYSVLPFYKELEDELKLKNSNLINSYNAHKFIANMEYIQEIKDLTPKTYFENYGFNNLPEGSYVLKGKTNSRKHLWNTHMFAETKKDIPKVLERLLDDQLIKDQSIVIREYIELEKIDEGINNLPITNEWRFFCLDGKIVDYSYYWSAITEKDTPKIDIGAFRLINQVLQKINKFCKFVVIDVAKTKNGKWIVIELNDAQMSGLSSINPEKFYKKLRDIIL